MPIVAARRNNRLNSGPEEERTEYSPGLGLEAALRNSGKTANRICYRLRIWSKSFSFFPRRLPRVWGHKEINPGPRLSQFLQILTLNIPNISVS